MINQNSDGEQDGYPGYDVPPALQAQGMNAGSVEMLGAVEIEELG